jgi:hypothetical protein
MFLKLDEFINQDILNLKTIEFIGADEDEESDLTGFENALILKRFSTKELKAELKRRKRKGGEGK